MKFRLALIICGCVLVAAFVFLALKQRPFAPLREAADNIVVHKEAHTMTLYRNGVMLATYDVALGRGGLEPKVEAGDNRVPEGGYTIVARNDHSAFHKALRVGYPTPRQTAEAKRRGVDPGGDIMIHGIRNGLGWLGQLQRRVDWTKGCVAVTNQEIDQIWQAVPVGTSVRIEP